MTTHVIASRDEWLEARRDLLAAEKDLTRRGDEVARLRRQLPWVRVEKDYVFEGPDGAGLARRPVRRPHPARRAAIHAGAGLGAGLQELLLHGRPYRRHARASGAARHRLRRDLARAVRRNRALPPPHGLAVPWVSSHGNDFNRDFRRHRSRRSEIASGAADYNFGGPPLGRRDCRASACSAKDEAGEVFHTYSTYGRGVEVMMGTYRMLDLTPKGRDEDGRPPMAWVRHHDRYETAAGAGRHLLLLGGS